MPGEILVLVYDPGKDAVITVQSMRGFSIFARFKEKKEYAGLALEVLRSLALAEDRRDLGLIRIFFRYKPNKITKRKGALIQAVEAVEKHLKTKRGSAAVAGNTGLLPDALSADSWEKDNAG